MKRPGSITTRVLQTLKDEPSLTATELAHRIGEKPASVSVAVLRLFKEGKIIRSLKPGPRGGKTYKLPPPPEANLWDRLRDGDLL